MQPHHVSCFGDLSRSRLTTQAEHNLAAITSHAIAQAIEVADSVVDDLLVLDSQNPKLLAYLTRLETFLMSSGNQTQQTLQHFLDIVEVFLDADVGEKTADIETQLIALCLQRNGFDRWKRTIQLRTSQILKSFGRKLQKYMETVDEEERRSLEQHWKLVGERDGRRKLDKLQSFIGWLARQSG
ncbi:hypothetical protein KR222_001452 [Zaprionus bogoriensis]|nr:hypothetical protein KR222_001452 [Zaprionus bogoriensis]